MAQMETAVGGPRIRSIKPEWLEDERLASATDTARMVSVALILLSDDYGNGRAHPLYLASNIWQYDSGEPRDTLAKLDRALAELVSVGFMRLYSVKGQQYFSVKNWSKHQRVDKPSRPRVPGPEHDDGTEPVPPAAGLPPAIARISGVSRETLVTDQGSGIRDQDQEGDRAGAREKPPLRAESKSGTRPSGYVDPRDDEFDEMRPDDRWRALKLAFEAVVHGGRPSVADDVAHKHLSLLLPAVEARADGDIVGVFTRVLTEYHREKFAAGKATDIVYFCRDFAKCADKPAAPALAESARRPIKTTAEVAAEYRAKQSAEGQP